jgi:hypothetical protein
VQFELPDRRDLLPNKRVETEFGHTIGEEEYPKIWLYQDGSGDECATWYVDVDYMGYEDSDFEVCGEVTIENTGDVDAVITDVEDLLGGSEAVVDFGVAFPYTLEVGDTLVGTYCEDGYVEGMNEVTVTTERDEYFADAESSGATPMRSSSRPSTSRTSATCSARSISAR